MHGIITYSFASLAKNFYEEELAEVGLKSPFKDGTIDDLVKNMSEKVF